MVTVSERPQGHKIIDQAISAVMIDSAFFDAQNNAMINFTSHGRSNGDIVYVDSDIDEYNGFWTVEVFNANAFYLTSAGDKLQFYQEISISYYLTQEHVWNSIFLPIVYKLTNDRWPVNSVDPVRGITAASDDNGFTHLTLDGPLKSVFNALEFVKLTGLIEGYFQIVEVISTSEIVINLDYDDSVNFFNVEAQYYYNNYQAKVKVYAGLPESHHWWEEKPYEEVAELSFTPDENNLVVFSVADYIKSKIKIANNLTLFSLPMNLDAFTGFYISLAESYDDSDNYALSTTESSYIDDSFEGYAIAGKLPFKNMYGGDYADYVYTSGSPAQWLISRERLLAVDGLYFDVSFIKNIAEAFFIRVTRTVGDYSFETDEDIENFGEGVYRVPVEADSQYDSICIQAYREGFTPAALDALNLWNETGSGYEWTDTTTPETLLINDFDSEFKYTDYAFVGGQAYTFQFSFQTIPSGSPLLTLANINIQIQDSVGTVVMEWDIDMLGSGSEELPPLIQWNSLPTVNSREWVVSLQPTVVLDGSDSDNIVSEVLYTDYAFVVGRTYRIDVSITITLTSGPIAGQHILQVLNSSGIALQNEFFTNAAGTFTRSITFVATAETVKFGIVVAGAIGTHITGQVHSADIIDTAGVTVTDEISFTAPEDSSTILIKAEQTGTGPMTYKILSFTLESESVDEVPITEQICIDILEQCDVGTIPSQEGRRLTEDGGYRLLE